MSGSYLLAIDFLDLVCALIGDLLSLSESSLASNLERLISRSPISGTLFKFYGKN